MKQEVVKKIPRLFIVIAFSLLGAITILDYPLPAKETVSVQTGRELVINEVIDGDTIKSASEIIRLIGIDTPEIGEPGYEDAKQVMTQLVLGKKVSAIAGKDTYDKYGRSLSYIYLGEIFVNKYMIEQGWAKTLPIRPNTLYAEKFLLAEEIAKKEKRGLWKQADE